MITILILWIISSFICTKSSSPVCLWNLEKVSECASTFLRIFIKNKSFMAADALLFRVFHLTYVWRLNIISDVVKSLLTNSFQFVLGFIKLFIVLLCSIFQEINFFFIAVYALLKSLCVNLTNNWFYVLFNVNFHSLNLAQRFTNYLLFNWLLLIL